VSATVLKFPAMGGTFPNRIRELRKAQGLTLKQLGHEIGIGITHMGDIEKGDRELTHAYMKRLARALQVKPVDLLLPEDQHEALAPHELILIDRFRRATPEQLDQLLHITEVIVPGGVPLRKAG
jgi:transcriptional regulator with XRE-family HTH domain